MRIPPVRIAVGMYGQRAVPKPGSSLWLSVVEAGRGIGSICFISIVTKHAIDFLTIVTKQG
jgi:hypothetical protein